MDTKNKSGQIVVLIFLLICGALGIAAFVMSFTKKCGEGFENTVSICNGTGRMSEIDCSIYKDIRPLTTSPSSFPPTSKDELNSTLPVILKYLFTDVNKVTTYLYVTKQQFKIDMEAITTILDNRSNIYKANFNEGEVTTKPVTKFEFDTITNILSFFRCIGEYPAYLPKEINDIAWNSQWNTFDNDNSCCNKQDEYDCNDCYNSIHIILTYEALDDILKNDNIYKTYCAIQKNIKDNYYFNISSQVFSRPRKFGLRYIVLSFKLNSIDMKSNK